MKTFLLIIISCLGAVSATAQKKPVWKQRFIIGHGIGYGFQMNTLRVDPVTDQLSSVNDKGLSLRFLTMDWFLKNNWGIEMSLYGLANDNELKRNKRFETLFKEQFEDRYYVNASLYSEGGLKNFTGNLGLVYKIERGRFTCIPKFIVGITEISYKNLYNLYLKEKNKNMILKVEYTSGSFFEEKLLLGPSVTAMYRFNSILGITFNASSFWHRATTDYTRQLTNQVTKEESANYYKGSKILHRLNFDLGIAIGFGKTGDWVGINPANKNQ